MRSLLVLEKNVLTNVCWLFVFHDNDMRVDVPNDGIPLCCVFWLKLSSISYYPYKNVKILSSCNDYKQKPISY